MSQLEELQTLESFFEKNYKIPYHNTKQHKNIRDLLLKLESDDKEGEFLIKSNQFYSNFRRAHGEDVITFIKIIQNKDKINEILLSHKERIRLDLYDDDGIYHNKKYFSEYIHFIIDDFEYKSRKNGKFVFTIKLKLLEYPILNKPKTNVYPGDVFFQLFIDGIDTYKDERKDLYSTSRLNKIYLKDLKEKYYQKAGYREVRLKNIYIPLHYENIQDFSDCESNSKSCYFFTKPFRDFLINIVENLN